MDTILLQKKLIKGVFLDYGWKILIQSELKSSDFSDYILSELYNILCSLKNEDSKDIVLTLVKAKSEAAYQTLQNILEDIEVNENELPAMIILLKQETLRKTVLSLSDWATSELFNDKTPEEVASAMIRRLTDCSAIGQLSKTRMIVDSMADFLKLAIQSDNSFYYKTGIQVLDREMGGIEKGKFMVLVADKGIGKTSLMIFICRNIIVSYPNTAVLFISLEMSELDVAKRFISMETRLTNRELNERTFHDGKVRKEIENAIVKYRSLPIEIYDRPLTIDEMENKCRLFASKNVGKDLIIILDSIGVIASKIIDDTVLTTQVSKSLANLKKELKCNIIALHHVTKEVGAKSNLENQYMPTESMFRGSGKIADNADVMMFAWRGDNYPTLIAHSEREFLATGDPKHDIKSKFAVFYSKNRTDGVVSLMFSHEIQYNLFK